MKFHEPVVNECMKMNNFVEEPKMAKAAFSLLVNYEHGNCTKASNGIDLKFVKACYGHRPKIV